VVSLATGGMEQSTISLENHDDDNPDQAYGNDFDTNRKYLTFSWWLLHRGWRDVMVKVEAAVRDVFGTLSPRDDVSMQRFSELTLEVRKLVEGATEAERQSSRWLQYLLPPKEQEDFVLKSAMGEDTATTGLRPVSSSGMTPLRRLLDETSDLIDSPPLEMVFQTNIFNLWKVLETWKHSLLSYTPATGRMKSAPLVRREAQFWCKRMDCLAQKVFRQKFLPVREASSMLVVSMPLKVHGVRLLIKSIKERMYKGTYMGVRDGWMNLMKISRVGRSSLGKHI
jgi:hypothetical protein